ncbi:1,6-dihydroxycyclohexa-2,4-diene-1-carboxylate dehydrogenase [Sphingobacterium sp. SG20118]|uniref:1,6-dihydroxycyclohexa-2,4-diene-1-carboxylate dehydrogenase n=1 Tax=Sphingobacterium TaxID=28453 RepID=UPI0004F6DC3D|nr:MULTISPECIES: 1,6-dihydroxycyclohexa-2,4-diene-1-carboxylate dehydrogenase [Sphingobacterium]AIM38019.1 1,6-dihydroxycyclohexa-2,4-diene-1-carboxylate dehydrogenase [Sphingobacterium sp. ML3W]MDH5825921.1 1,6-dihydroxycyclohexa-2,4-diene-1-carboxylate dehydrogenase [Sphingobacterium faecium]
MIFQDRFKNKVIIVTGAAQGIGKGVAERVAQEGAKTILVDRSEKVLELTKNLTDNGFDVIAVQADLETFQGFEEVSTQAIQAFGKIDILINNVGGTIWAKPFEHYQEEEIIKEVNRSLFPTLWGCRSVLPHMITNGGGVIVNVSSVATRSVNRVPYAAAKGGVNAITASLAFEQAANNIRIVGVAPGGTEAPERHIPRNENPLSANEKIWYQQIVDQTISSSLQKKYGTIDDQVATILFMASDEAKYITGVTIPVAGGDLG